MTWRRSLPHEGVVSPCTTNANPYITPVWRDCTPARRLAGRVGADNQQRRELLDDHALSTINTAGAIVAQGGDDGALGKPVAPARPDVYDCALARERRETYYHHRENRRAGHIGLAPAVRFMRSGRQRPVLGIQWPSFLGNQSAGEPGAASSSSYYVMRCDWRTILGA